MLKKDALMVKISKFKFKGKSYKHYKEPLNNVDRVRTIADKIMIGKIKIFHHRRTLKKVEYIIWATE